MSKMIYINLPVTDVAAATRFYEAIGFMKNETFSNEQASGMQWSDTIYVMLLDHGFYSTFTDKKIIDAKTTSGALLCVSFDSKEAVEDVHRRAVEAGGTETRKVEAQGPMFGGAFEDPDGHIWETLFMDPAAMADTPTPEGADA